MTDIFAPHVNGLRPRFKPTYRMIVECIKDINEIYELLNYDHKEILDIFDEFEELVTDDTVDVLETELESARLLYAIVNELELFEISAKKLQDIKEIILKEGDICKHEAEKLK